MAKKRALENPTETMCRQEQNQANMAKKRALQTPNEILYSQDQARIRMAKKRALENLDETMIRQKQNRANMAKLRALENPDETQCRQEQNRAYMTMKRGTLVSVDNAISTFLLKAKMGPDYICTCCHRMMYRVLFIVTNLSILRQVVKC